MSTDTKSRQAMETGLAKYLDLNIDHVQATPFTEGRPKQVFNQARSASAWLKAGYAGTAGGLVCEFTAIAMDNGPVAFVGLLTVLASMMTCAFGADKKDKVSKDVKAEIAAGNPEAAAAYETAPGPSPA